MSCGWSRAAGRPTPERRRRIARCHRHNAETSQTIVRRHGSPDASLVDPAAATAALTILRHAPGRTSGRAAAI
ncbi:hypothetical protein ACE1SV_03440 [Streptomyces sennicomposti]